MTNPEAAELRHGERVLLGGIPGAVDTVAVTRGIMGVVVSVRVDLHLEDGTHAVVSGDFLHELSRMPSYDAWAGIFSRDGDGYEMGRD